MLFRISRALIVAGMMYFSLRYLNISKGTSLAMGLIPAILISLDVMARAAYIMSGTAFILACGSTLFSELNLDMGGLVKSVSPVLKKLGLA